MVVASRPLSTIGVFWVVLWIDIFLFWFFLFIFNQHSLIWRVFSSKICSRSVLFKMGVTAEQNLMRLSLRKLLRQLLCQQSSVSPDLSKCLYKVIRWFSTSCNRQRARNMKSVLRAKLLDFKGIFKFWMCEQQLLTQIQMLNSYA